MNPDALPSNWGLRAVLFHAGGLAVPSYETFVLLAIVAGFIAYWLAARKQPELGDRSAYLIMAALVGGVFGAKAPVWVMHYCEVAAAHSPLAWLSGRTIVGGLIGGTAAVALTRPWLGMRERSGNLFAVGMALALAVGRIGCLLRGCCYGVPTSLPWGLDLGDGIRRHPTQLYESLFAFGLFAWLVRASRRHPSPGAMFRTFMLAYFSFRFAVEFLRFEPRTVAGLTLAQIVSIGVVGYYLTIGRIANHPPLHEVAPYETVQSS
ncbi:MAG TPA: prolipoprotein diacylglyceryl transferase family protein [Armatimonadota bacterium]|jgi:prolipoprotein diacylglyceryltransferase